MKLNGPIKVVIPPIKITTKSIDIKRILVYSASMIIANPPLVFGVESRDQLRFSFSKIERGSVSFRQA